MLLQRALKTVLNILISHAGVMHCGYTSAVKDKIRVDLPLRADILAESSSKEHEVAASIASPDIGKLSSSPLKNAP